MASTTSNYGLNKPTKNEYVNIEIINQNMDIIDTNLKSLSDEINTTNSTVSNLSTVASSGSYNDLSDKPTIPTEDDYMSQKEVEALLSDYAKIENLPNEYDDTELSNRIQAIENDYLTSVDKTDITTAIATAKTEAIETIPTLVEGDNITLTTNTDTNEITISSTNIEYTHPTTDGNKHIPSGGSSGQILEWSASGTAKWVTPNFSSSSGTTVYYQSDEPNVTDTSIWIG